VRDGNSPGPDEPAENLHAAGGSDRATAPLQGSTSVNGEPGAVHVILGADRTRIVLSGEVDADLGPDLQEATTEAEEVGLPIEVDTHHVTFMDSSGVAFLARLAIRSQHPVQLLRVPPTVRFLLEVTRIGELLEVVEDDSTTAFEAVPDTGGTSPDTTA
jgi:anti-sigma B factor antagonist